jgi:hypothetical protein
MDTIPLEQAADHIKLAVDLIQLLEDSEVTPEVSILALEIVLQDMHKKSCDNYL